MADAEVTKARLLEAAGEEFAEHGFAAARVRSICRRAGARGESGRDQLSLWRQRTALRRRRAGSTSLRDARRSAPTCEPISSRAPELALRAFIGQFLANILNASPSGWHHALMLREMLQPTGACEAVVRESIRPRFEHLLAILRRFCPRADERRLYALAFSVIGQCLHYKLRGR